LNVYCADGGGIDEAQDNFLGMTVSGVGISCPVIISGSIGVESGGLIWIVVEFGLLASSLP